MVHLVLAEPLGPGAPPATFIYPFQRFQRLFTDRLGIAVLGIYKPLSYCKISQRAAIFKSLVY